MLPISTIPNYLCIKPKRRYPVKIHCGVSNRRRGPIKFYGSVASVTGLGVQHLAGPCSQGKSLTSGSTLFVLHRTGHTRHPCTEAFPTCGIFLSLGVGSRGLKARLSRISFIVGGSALGIESAFWVFTGLSSPSWCLCHSYLVHKNRSRCPLRTSFTSDTAIHRSYMQIAFIRSAAYFFLADIAFL
jgi:hypothetical protein